MKKQSAGRRVRREKIRRKQMQVREKVGKSRNTVFFRGFDGLPIKNGDFPWLC
jgi:hypothetical protein